MSDMEIIEFDDPEQNKLAETRYYEFLDWLNAQRRTAENAVRELFPRLVEGVPVQEIKRVAADAAYWYEIPDELAGSFAYESARSPAQYERHTLIARTLDIHVCQFWLDCHYLQDESDELPEDAS